MSTGPAIQTLSALAMMLGQTEINTMSPDTKPEHATADFELKVLSQSHMNAQLDSFLSHYHQLDHNQLDLLEQMYTKEVLFIDPFHQIQGIQALKDYFSKLYQNIDSFKFTFTDRFLNLDQASVYWELRFEHPRINSGKQICLLGNSRLQFDGSGRVTEHRDYFDSAAMLYRHLPILKQVISLIDGRLA